MPEQLDAIVDLRRRLYRALEGRPEACPEGTADRYTPPLDIVHLPEALLISVELPGVEREDIEVVLEGNLLTISGERKTAEAEAGRHFYRRERPRGRFSRSLALPGATEQDLSANLKDGVLTVTVKKSPAPAGDEAGE